MAWATRTAEMLLQALRHLHAKHLFRALGIDLRIGGTPERIDSGLSRHKAIGVEIPGILLKILPSTELERIDVNTGKHRTGIVTDGTGVGHQAPMTLVQTAHGGNEMHWLGLLSAPMVQFRECSENLNGQRSTSRRT